MYMQENKDIVSSAKVVEAEVLDENGRPIGEEEKREKLEEHMARAGFLAGFVALAFSVIMILVTAVVTQRACGIFASLEERLAKEKAPSGPFLQIQYFKT